MAPIFKKKAKLLKWPKCRGSGTSMDIILLFLAKPLDKHGITYLHLNNNSEWREEIATIIRAFSGFSFSNMAGARVQKTKTMSKQLSLESLPTCQADFTVPWLTFHQFNSRFILA